MQNRLCGNRGVEEVITSLSVDAGVAVVPTPPSILPTFTVVQRRQRVVCLVLDVSGSMRGQRIQTLRQAASFNSKREELVDSLPKTDSGGGTQICEGLKEGLKVLQGDDGNATGDEIVFLTDGESNTPMDCLTLVNKSGAIVHTISLGPNGDKQLPEMSNISGGKFFRAEEGLNSNELVDVFASLTTSDGNLTQQTIQLESSGLTTSDWFNGKELHNGYSRNCRNWKVDIQP
ncbi:hypothetical protein J4Q44_G00152740 [Coregonus suidteri]|uniref:VWFA domain-containing protein n=1 Tax=Coregonus suidteri TaxID=861788 RepID=A0AAN8LL39_9TELE